ncbi:MAG: PspC domain-containing protein [Cyclobacteriaceae bacterium]
MVKKLQQYWEFNVFGVCTRLGQKIGLSSSAIRIFFIYVSFVTYGSPVVVYLALAFIMKMRQHLRRRSIVWDL